MSRDFREEYTEMLATDMPDLWDRIEASLPEKEKGEDTKQDEERKHIDEFDRQKKRKRNIRIKVCGSVAACLCVIVSGAVIFLGQGNQGMEVASTTAESSMVTVEEVAENAEVEVAAVTSALADDMGSAAAADLSDEENAEKMRAATTAEEEVVAEEEVMAEEEAVAASGDTATPDKATVEAAIEEAEDDVVLDMPTYINAKAAVLIDADTGQVLFEQDGDTALPPASTTKVMTALLTVEAIEAGKITLEQEITVDNNARNITPIGGSVLALPIEEGEIVTIRDLLYAVLLKSDCVCCNILAEIVSGDVDTFVAQMNERAKEIGCTNTTFMNTHGYKEKGHEMSAHDLALIAAEAMRHPDFYQIVDTAEYTIPATNLHEARELRNTNWLLGTMWDRNVASYNKDYEYPYAHGVKTGYTAEAGHCLASYVEKDGKRLVCAILGAEIETNESTGYLVNYMYEESIRLYDWALSAYTSVPVTVENETLSVVGGTQETVAVGLADEESILLSKALDIDMIEQHIVYKEDTLTAPIEKGTEVGSLQIMLQGEILDEFPLIATEEIVQVQNVEEQESIEENEEQEQQQEETSTMSVGRMILVIGIILLVLVVGLVIFYFVRKNYYFD